MASHPTPRWPVTATTRDGKEYRVRPIKVSDLERDRAFLEHLSPLSRYHRMMSCLSGPPPEVLNQLVHVDRHREMALVAAMGAPAAETIVAVARYGGHPEHCEFAIAVADEWQSHGIGTHLARMLFEYAKQHGVRRMYAILFASNWRMLKLAGDLHMEVRRSPDDLTLVEAWRTL